MRTFLVNERFDFGRSTGLRKKIAAQIPGAVKRMSSFQPAKELVFLDRMVAGHYGNLRVLGPVVPLMAMVRAYLDLWGASGLDLVPDGG